MKLRVVFFGTPAMAVPVLSSLANHEGLEVVAIVTQPAKPVGRLGVLTTSPVADAGRQLGLKVLELASLKPTEAQTKITELQPDFLVVAAYGKIIPAAWLEIPKLGAINIHPSLLPKYRGAAPLQGAILNQETTSGVSIILMDAELDHGPILKQWPERLKPDDTTETLGLRLFTAVAKKLPEVLVSYAAGKISPVEQDHREATFTKLLAKQDGRIDWTMSAAALDAKRRAFTPWPGVYAFLADGAPIKVLESVPIPACEKTVPGQLHHKNDDIHVGTGAGCLRLKSVQLAGKRVMRASDLLRGYPAFFELPQNQLRGAARSPEGGSGTA